MRRQRAGERVQQRERARGQEQLVAAAARACRAGRPAANWSMALTYFFPSRRAMSSLRGSPTTRECAAPSLWRLSSHAAAGRQRCASPRQSVRGAGRRARLANRKVEHAVPERLAAGRPVARGQAAPDQAVLQRRQRLPQRPRPRSCPARAPPRSHVLRARARLLRTQRLHVPNMHMAAVTAKRQMHGLARGGRPGNARSPLADIQRRRRICGEPPAAPAPPAPRWTGRIA